MSKNFLRLASVALIGVALMSPSQAADLNALIW